MDRTKKLITLAHLNKGLRENIAERLKLAAKTRKRRKLEKENDSDYDPADPDYVLHSEDDDECSDASSCSSFDSAASPQNSKPRRKISPARRLFSSPKDGNNSVLLNPCCPIATSRKIVSVNRSRNLVNVDIDDILSSSNIRPSTNNDASTSDETAETALSHIDLLCMEVDGVLPSSNTCQSDENENPSKCACYHK